MKKLIAYFDYLGFKQFIDNNDLTVHKRTMIHIFRDMEMALSKGKSKIKGNKLISDLTESQINCISFSDTVMFWTEDTSESSIIEFLEVVYRFNWQAILYCFPVRGSLVFGEIEYVDFKQESLVGAKYNINSVFGQGLVDAHVKAESQNWAGTVCDSSFIEMLVQLGYEPDKILPPFAKKYKVPYKNEQNQPEEYVLCLMNNGKISKDAFQNISDGIIRNFGDLNKSIDSPSIQEKIKNTIKFLESFT